MKTFKKNILSRMKIYLILFISLCLAFNFGCKKDVEQLMTESKLETNGLTKDINSIVSQALIDEMKDLGMSINTGENPPQIVSSLKSSLTDYSFILSPNVLIQTNIPTDVLGSIFADNKVKFYNQDNSKLTITLDYYNGSESGIGIGAFIVGEGSRFTVFAKTQTKISSCISDVIWVYSGTIVSNVIQDVIISNFMIDDHGDACKVFIENDQGRVFSNGANHIFLPTISTNPTSVTTSNSATCGGEVTSTGGGTITNRGVCWSKSSNPTISDSKTSDGTGTGSFSSSITGLSANTTYYVRAYATNSAGTAYGAQITLTTLSSVSLPTVTTSSSSNISSNSAACGGEVTSAGGGTIINRGVCWSKSANPTISDSKTSDGKGAGSFSSSITGLSAKTNYYVRAYATNSAGTAYGSQITLTTLSNVSLPTVTTSSSSNISSNSATCGGDVTADGGALVTEKGVCWGISSNPTVGDSKTIDGTGTGSFSSNLTGLSANTNYFVRAYATNSAGTAYGSQITLTTLNNVSIPTVITSSASNILSNSATCGGDVTADGGALVTEKGVCWGIISNPTVSDSKTLDGTGTGSFSSSINGLSANTTYYVRAYATNSVGTAYGSQITLTTVAGVNLNLNGKWSASGTGFTILEDVGTFYSFSSNWQLMADAGFVKFGDLYLKNISQISTLKWNCSVLFLRIVNNVATETYWSSTATIEMSSDGNTITISASGTNSAGQTNSGSAKYYRQTSKKSASQYQYNPMIKSGSYLN